MQSPPSSPIRDDRVAAAGLRASGVIGAVGLGFLVAMFGAFAVGARSAGMALGWVNDVTGIVTLPLALPGMLAFHARLRPHAGRAGDALLVVGIGSAGAVAVLQLLLVMRVLTFEQEVGPVTIAYLGFGAWLVVSSRVGRRAGVLDFGTGTGILAALMVGYPVWAFRLARLLGGSSAPDVAPSAPAAIEA